jgi:hypothetical protein
MEAQTPAKQELKNWIDRLDNDIIMLLLQSLKEAPSLEEWFWEDIAPEQKKHIITALKKAKNSDKYSQKDLWNDIKRQYKRAKHDEISEEQMQEIKRRVERIESGEAELIPGEQVIARLKKKHGL